MTFMADLIQYFITGLMAGSIYALLAVAFVMIYKTSKIFNFAQGELMLVSAFVSWSLIAQLNVTFWVTMLLTMTFACLLGFGIERFPLRSMVGQSTLSIIMVTLGLSLLLRSVVLIFWGATLHPYPVIFPAKALVLSGFSVSQQHLWSLISCMALLSLFGVFFRFTDIGLVMRAVAEDQMVAKSTGTRVNRFIGLSWAIACVISAIAGVFLSAINGVSSGLAEFGLKAIAAALVGGLESIGGAVCGGLIIGVVEVLSTAYIGHGISEVAAFIVLVGVLVVKPYGLFGLTRIERV